MFLHLPNLDRFAVYFIIPVPKGGEIMKTAKVTVVAFLAIGLSFMLLPQNGDAEQKFGVGGKLIGQLPFLVGSLEINQLGVEVGGGMWSVDMTPDTDVSVPIDLIYYCASGTYKYPLNKKVQPYIGGGVVGASGSEEIQRYTGGTNPEPVGKLTMSGQTIGYNVLAGLELPLESYGIPITAFGGVNYLEINDLTLTHEDVDLSNYPTYSIPFSGINFHIGAKFEF